MEQTAPRSREAEASAELPELMLRYQAGDALAFEALYGLLARSLRGYLRTFVPRGTEVEVLVQDTFLQLHRSRRSYLPGEPVRPWVFAIARHVGLMARRGAGRRGKHEVQSSEELPEIPTVGRAAGLADRLYLNGALWSLPESQREAVWLHHVVGLSFREIAAVQGTTETAAKVRSHRGLVALRERLQGDAK